MAFAAAVMALATNEDVYKTDAINFWNQYGFGTYLNTYSDWGSKHMSLAIVMARVFGDQKYKQSAQDHCDYWVNTMPKTPKGLVYIADWGSLRHASNAAFGCFLAADTGIGDVATYKAFAKKQIDYALGSTGRSFVVGFGVNPPLSCHHRGA